MRFTITAWVDRDHEAYDDPEWVADAVHGALREYGIECIYEHIEALPPEEEDGRSRSVVTGNP
mgnify:CR=1 FL=1